jgi:general secretion pathway protein F
MPLYEYKGVGTTGKDAKGVIEADSSKSARIRLKQKGVYTTEIRERNIEKATKENKKTGAAASRGTGGVKMRNFTMMTRQLSTLVKARIPLDEALAALIEQTDDNKLKSVMSRIKESVNEGKTLADSCKMFPKVFPPIFTSMIKVGEMSGNLDVVLNRLAAFAENQYETRNKVIGALVYPMVMMVAGLGITIFLFAFAVPKITEVFAGSKMPLPGITVFMISISGFTSQHWLTLVLTLVGSFFLFKWYTNTKAGRDWWDAVSLKIPGYGKLKRMIAVSRFARTLSTMIGSGIQLLDAIDVVKDVVDNAVIRKALIASRESISEGHTIAGPLKASGEFPPILTHMIAVGEKTGELEEMLNVVSDSYDSQVDNAIKSMTRVIEPLMIVIMGVVIGLVAISIFLPMLQLNDLTTLNG